MELVGINVHPVKSTAIRPVREAYVGRAGLDGDRQWMVVDSSGDLVSARELPSLFGVIADTASTADDLQSPLRLRADGHDDLLVDRPAGARRPVRVHRHPLEGVPAGDAADAWLRRVTGRDDLSLVWCDDPSRRRLNPEWARPEDHTAFADSAPVTLASTASLAQLNEWLLAEAVERGDHEPEPLPVSRFRANLIVDGSAAPFIEDTWTRVHIGDVPFRVAARVDRCVMTTIDPESQDKGKEPIRTLARHRRWNGKTWFAVKLLPDGEGTVRLGDPVTPAD